MKKTFNTNTYAAKTFASGTFRGVGTVVAATSGRLFVFGQSRPLLTVRGEIAPLLAVKGQIAGSQT